MKKNQLLMLATAAIFAGCSNGEVIDEKGGNNEPGIGEYSDVEVAFGKASNIVVSPANSRAAVDGWDKTKISIWGLEKNTSWNIVAGQLFGQTAPAAATVAAGGVVTFDNAKKYYYPMSSSVEYSFYACHPANTTANVSAGTISANYTIDGKTDIMWAKKEATPTENGLPGYNAKYFRNGGAAPTLPFKHCLTRLDFKAITGVISNPGVGATATKPVAVKSIKISGVPTAGALTVAGTNAGTLTATGNGELSIYNGDTALGSISGVDYLIQPGTEVLPSTLGSVLFYPSGTNYTITITLVGVNIVDGKIVSEMPGTEQTSRVVIDFGEDLALGTRYNVNLTIYPLQEVVFGTASIADWTTGKDINVDVN